MESRPHRSRSPLKQPPQRQAGEGLSEYLHTELFSYWVLLIGGSLLLVLFAAIEWARWFWAWRPQPLAWTVVALLFGAHTVWKIVTGWSHAKDIVLGMRGERAVDEALNPLRAEGYHVFHDLPGRRGNVDHVIVGPAGVFAIETKAARKPAKGRPVIRYDGTAITLNGAAPVSDPLVQARAVASEVADRLRESTGRSVAVRPVVCFPGWFVEGEREAPVWVLHQDRVPKWVLKEAQIKGQMPDEDVHLFADRLAAWARRDTAEA